MGLFDKLSRVVNTMQTKDDPFLDATLKEYYMIAYGLLSSVTKMNCTSIKKYIEFHTNSSCEDDKVQKILRFFNYGQYNNVTFYSRFKDASTTRSNLNNHNLPAYKGISSSMAEKVIEMNTQLDTSPMYICTKEEAYNICLKESLTLINTEFDNVLNVVNENGLKFFDDGLNKIIQKHSCEIIKEDIQELIHSLMYSYFLAGHDVVQRALVGRLDNCLYNKKYHFQIAAITLRALHFEKNNKNSDYQTITPEICLKFVLNNDYYKNAIEEHPFEKEEHVKKYMNEIVNAKIFESGIYYYLPRCKEEIYFSDFLCNLYWKHISEKYEDGNSTNPNDIFNMIWNDLNE